MADRTLTPFRNRTTGERILIRNKILYVDDEAMALKYFERLISPLAPVLTASSAEAGRALLDARSHEIAVLVSDQRMPGEHGNGLLRHAREHHPGVVRMLTTAYSDIGEAIEAINRGEIFRYVAKPWALELLRVDLRNALDMAAVRAERDELLGQKLMVEQARLLGQRIGQLRVLGAALGTAGHEAAVREFVSASLAAGVGSPMIDWRRWDHAELQRAEAERAVQLVDHLRCWWSEWGAVPQEGIQRVAALARALDLSAVDGVLRVAELSPLTAVLGGAPDAPLSPKDAVGLAWLLWAGGAARLLVKGAVCTVLSAVPAVLPQDWLTASIEFASPPLA